ncbi:MAG TPA: C4-dicarboxylate transporter DcuC [Gemmataceae bacterium]|nr:C4-dicarboxylate transporter DcuC [Gemmataceae bacterium]
MVLALGVLVIVLTVWAVYHRIEVRLAMIVSALALATIAGNPMAVVRTFLATFSNERFVVPICTAMGFAFVLRYTGCDQHLVHLLMKPVQRVRLLLVPGTVAVGFLVNIPVVSQTSTAVTLGAVVIPILLAAGLSRVTVAAALLLGASIGGELLNPGAPELRTIVEESDKAAKKLGKPSPGLTGAGCVAHILPLDLLGLAVTIGVFWFVCARAERKSPRREQEAAPPPETPAPAFRVNLLMAMVPIVPLFLLFLTSPPLKVVTVPPHWLVDLPRKAERECLSILAVAPQGGLPAAVPWHGVYLNAPPTLGGSERGLYDSRLVGSAMIIGVLVAGLIVWRKGLGVTGAFFEGAGYGFTHIISLIVAANCFGAGIEAIGLATVVGGLIRDVPWLLLPAAGILSLGFAVLCGSGMATTQSLFKFFAEPALELGIDPATVGAVVSLAAAGGRTISPVSAVGLMCAAMADANPLLMVRRLLLPVLAGLAAVVLGAIFMAMSG